MLRKPNWTIACLLWLVGMLAVWYFRYDPQEIDHSDDMVFTAALCQTWQITVALFFLLAGEFVGTYVRDAQLRWHAALERGGCLKTERKWSFSAVCLLLGKVFLMTLVLGPVVAMLIGACGVNFYPQWQAYDDAINHRVKAQPADDRKSRSVFRFLTPFQSL